MAVASISGYKAYRPEAATEPWNSASLSVQPAGRVQPAEQPSTSPAGSILLAEDDDELRAILAEAVRARGYLVTECRNGADLVSQLDRYLRLCTINDVDSPEYDLVVSDVRMPGVSGTSVVEGAKNCTEFPPIILITAFPDEDTIASANRCGVNRVLSKPFAVSELLAAIDGAIEP